MAIALQNVPTAPLLRGALYGAHRYERAIHATIHPSARAYFDVGDGRRTRVNWARAMLDVIDFFPLREFRDPLLGDHHRVTSGTADALEFRRAHHLLERYRLGAVGRLHFSKMTAPVFLVPLENSFDVAPVRLRARATESLPVDEPSLLRRRIAASLTTRLTGIEAAAAPPLERRFRRAS